MKYSQQRDLYRYSGDLNALCGIRDFVFNDGTARGIRAFDLEDGKGLRITVAADRGMGIPYASYKGINISLLNKVGLRSPYLYAEDGARSFMRNFHGGLLTTGGLSYAGAADVEGDRVMGLHGVADNTPANGVRAWRDVVDDEIVLRVSGEIHESEVFRENLSLYRTISLATESGTIFIEDKVVNHGFAESELMLVYHINFGYPLLSPGARVYSTASVITPRTAFAAEGMDMYNIMEEPGVGREEQCYMHTGFSAEENFAMLHNETLGLATIVGFDAKALPMLCEWKAMCAGDYALGLEPTTSGVLSRNDARKNGTVAHIAPGEEKTFKVSIRVTEDADVIRQYIRNSH